MYKVFYFSNEEDPFWEIIGPLYKKSKDKEESFYYYEGIIINLDGTNQYEWESWDIFLDDMKHNNSIKFLQAYDDIDEAKKFVKYRIEVYENQNTEKEIR